MNKILSSVKNIFIENKHFLITYILIFTFFIIFYLLNNKGDEIFLLNKLNNIYYDNFFKFSSDLAEGIYYSILLLILGTFSFKYLFNGVITFLFSGGITQILKRIFDYPRPKLFLGESIISNLHIVEGVKLYSKFSFPSGHTTAAFSMMFFLSLIIPNKYAKILFAIFAAFMGLSRVYLVQHFLIDVIAGSIVGILSTLFIYKFILVQEKIIFSKWYNFSLVEKIFKRKFNNDI